MMVTLDAFGHIAEIEFGNLVAERQPFGEKLRLYLSDGSYIDIWLSRRLHERFGFHWERRHLETLAGLPALKYTHAMVAAIRARSRVKDDLLVSGMEV